MSGNRRVVHWTPTIGLQAVTVTVRWDSRQSLDQSYQRNLDGLPRYSQRFHLHNRQWHLGWAPVAAVCKQMLSIYQGSYYLEKSYSPVLKYSKELKSITALLIAQVLFLDSAAISHSEASNARQDESLCCLTADSRHVYHANCGCL